MDGFYADLGAAYNKAVHAFDDAGCRCLQLDDISLACLCDPEQRAMLRMIVDTAADVWGRTTPGGHAV